MTSSETVSVLFVCTGNICRSPTAEGVFRHFVRQAGLEDRIRVDSAGTIRYHEGRPPDPRSVRAAGRRGIDITDLRARQFVPGDFEVHDYLLAMDRGHVFELRDACPVSLGRRIHLFLDFADGLQGHDVPDPYEGDTEDFEEVLDLVQAGARGLLRHIRTRDL